MAINQQLRTARDRMHWSLQRAADACKVDLQTFYRWESGKQSPHGYNLDQLCEVFRTSAAELGYAPYEVENEEGDSTVDANKRKTLRNIFAVTGIAITAPLSLVNPEPWERLTQAVSKPTTINAETINHFSHLLKTCQDLSNGTEMQVAGNLLSQFLPRLQELAPYQPEVASLAAQGLHLSSILVAHNLKIEEKILLCKQAVVYARQSSNTAILVASLLELAVAFQYSNNPMQALQSYQEALLYSNEVSPVLQARTYAETGFALARHGRKQEALFYLGLAHDTLPDQPELDQNFALSDFCGPATLSLYHGLIYLEAGKPNEAWEGFEQFKSHPATLAPERIRLEVVNHQGQAAIQQADLDKYTQCLEDGLAGAVTLGSKKRFDEAITIFQQIPLSWRKETQIRSLIEQYSLL